jgi:hypothetical protein
MRVLHCLCRAGMLPVVLLLLACAEDLPTPSFSSQNRVLKHTVRIASEGDSEAPLTRVFGIAANPTRVFVGEGMDRDIKVFSRAGEYLHSIGRRGMGPGEFVNPVWLGLCGDSLWVFDAALNRLTFLTDTGEVMSTLHVSPLPIGGERIRVSWMRPLANGLFLGALGYSSNEIASGRIRARPLLRLDSLGLVVDTLAVLSVDPKSTMVFRKESETTFVTQPVREDPLFDISPDGGGIVIVDRRVPDDPEKALLVVTKITADGDTIYEARLRYEPRRLDHRSVRQRFLSPYYVEEVARVTESELRDALWLPRYLPPVSQVRLGADGTVWLRREDDFVSSHLRWEVLDPSGAPLFWVWMSRGVQVLWVSSGSVWGVELDEWQVPQVVELEVAELGEGAI